MRCILLVLSVAALMAAMMVSLTAVFSSTTTAQTSQSVASFDLINADTDQVIKPLNDGDALDLSTLPTRNLNVRANTSPSTVGSVTFGYDSNASYRTERWEPYAFEGNNGSDYSAWTPSAGSHTITATPWSGSGATGTKGTAKSVNFDVADGAASPSIPPPTGGSGATAGDFKKWHPVTISFTGPPSSETNSSPNPFLDYRLQVAFTSPSGKSFDVPGFYDGDGNGSSSGSSWKVRFNPDESGTWGYKASFRQGANVATATSATAGAATSFDGASGTFDIADRDSAAPGFLSQGLLEYANGHYLKFRDGSYYLKGGADSPENWLGYAGFDNTPNAKHSFSPHSTDWQAGDPSFNTSSPDGGKGIIGALNYLSSQEINSVYFLPMNVGGDGQDSSPYVSVSNWAGSTSNDNYHFDVSKLKQWEQAFAHAQKKGIHLHFVLNEAETANKQELDGGTLGNERKLFYREMVARFAHHNALQWNISEEYDLNYNLGSDNVKSFAGYIQGVDPYDHPITVHQANSPDTTWTPFVGDSRFSLTSFQFWGSYAGYGAEVEKWRAKTASAGRPLPIGMDELISATTTNAADMRKSVLWPTYLSGGNLEWFIEAEDQSLEDLRRYASLWTYTRYARNFVEDNLKFWEMSPQDALLTGESPNDGQVFAKAGDTYAVYLPNATNSGSLDLSGDSGSYEKKWFNPRTGAFEGSAQTVSGGGPLSLGAAPSSPSEDWVILLKTSGTVTPPPADTTSPTVGKVSPAVSATNVAANTNVEATFSESMDPSTITNSTFSLTKQGSSTRVEAAVSYEEATKKATLNPNSVLEPGSTYTASVEGGSIGCTCAEDVAGNTLAQDKTWSFKVHRKK